MNIGILTYAGGLNYGSQAQLYAMTNYLKEKGHNITVLMFKPKYYFVKNIKIALRVEPNWQRHPKHIMQSIKRMKAFNNWIKNIPNQIEVKDGKEVDGLDLDLVIAGSDEILNCKHPFYDDIYIGKDIDKTALIYYAPSTGALSVDYVLSDEQITWFQKFKNYSARDVVTKKFIENNEHQEVTVVLDPTFLWEFNEITCKTKLGEKSIVLYSFDSIADYADEIIDYANKHEYEIVSLAREYRWANINLPAATEQEWITCFRNCEVVITDSYHGLVFALKNKKKVVLISREDKLNKNNGLLEFLGIQMSYYKKGSIDRYLHTETLDYSIINENIKKRKIESEKYLSEALENL